MPTFYWDMFLYLNEQSEGGCRVEVPSNDS